MKPHLPDPSATPPESLPSELAALVALARDQPLPPLRTAPARLHAAYLVARAQQTRRRTALVGLVGLALAAGLAALALIRLDLGLSSGTGPNGHVAQDISSAPPASGLATPRALAAGVRVTARDPASPAATVLGPWTLELAPGTYALEVDPHPGPQQLHVRSPGGALELHHGRVEIVVAASHTHARLHEGRATWTPLHGPRQPLTPSTEPNPPAAPSTELDPPAALPADRLDVRALARRAEALITAGQRDDAIAVLRQIVLRHPDEPPARGALLDLAPLLKAAGRRDDARCAYRLYLERYPGKAQLAADVRRALGRLGPGPDCDGLRPR